MKHTMKRTTALATVMTIAGGALWAQELTVLVDNSPDSVATIEALTDAYTARNPDVTFEIETRPGGGEGDNVVKTRLATGDMTDIFLYNSGSLLQALRPDLTLEPLDDLPAMTQVLDSFKQAVSGPSGAVYGVPEESAMGGGIFYHIPTYERLGLEIPTTWDAFMANNQRIADETDIAPVIQTYRDTWTSQLFVLADYYNVQHDASDFDVQYTGNAAKFATTPAALRSFERLQQVYEAGFMNEDFGAASYPDGLRMIASGEGAHYPMLTFAIGAIQTDYPDLVKDVGFFAQPGDDAAANGLTVWMPAAYYVPKSSENLEIAKDFANFVASADGCQTIIDTVGATGPSLNPACTVPADVPPSVSDMQKYFDAEGMTAPALEYLSPVKGPSLEQITVAVGSGINTAAEGAALYDQDVAKQAKQLGLPNW